MNRSELIAAVARQAAVDKKTAGAVLGAFEEVVLATTKTGKEAISWTGFLKIEQGKRRAGTARNPQTGETIKTKAKKVPKITAGVAFKRVVNGEQPGPKLKS